MKLVLSQFFTFNHIHTVPQVDSNSSITYQNALHRRQTVFPIHTYQSGLLTRHKAFRAIVIATKPV